MLGIKGGQSSAKETFVYRVFYNIMLIGLGPKSSCQKCQGKHYWNSKCHQFLRSSIPATYNF